MGSFQYQREKKRESEERIINALGGEELRFTELLKKTGLSKPVLNDHIKRLRKEGKIERIKQRNRRPYYKLVAGALKYGYIRRIMFSVLSTQIFNDVFEATGRRSWSDEEFVRRFSKKVGLLATFVLYTGLSIGRDDPEEGGKWIEDAFGTLFQKYAWRRCFFRQIFGGEYNLKNPVLLKEPVSPELRDGLVKLPEAFVPGLSSKILSELPNVPHNKMEAFKRSLEEVFPKEMEKLNEILTLIENDRG
jgi:DNA-binding transcriptional ArsR family regulator